MSFMKPEIIQADFHQGESRHGETTVTPADVYGTLAKFAQECKLVPDTCEVVEGKFWGRLSAPGYMDCTDWHGPHDTAEECLADLTDAYDLLEDLDGDQS